MKIDALQLPLGLKNIKISVLNLTITYIANSQKVQFLLGYEKKMTSWQPCFSFKVKGFPKTLFQSVIFHNVKF